MTTISIQYQSGEWEICIEGHAGYRQAKGLPEGTDIVCAAVSILAQTAAQCFLDLSGDGVQVKEMELDAEKGKVRISASVCQKREEIKHRVETMVWTVKNGLELLTEAYPEYVQFR